MSIVTTHSPAGSSEEPGVPGNAASERAARLCAQTALFMRDHVLSLVSHDLRSPLNAIHSWAYVLERKVDGADATAQRALAGIRSGVEQQVQLLESIVDTTRAETKNLALDRERFELRPLVDTTVIDVRDMLAQQRGVRLMLETPLAAEQLDGDRERVAAALWLMLTFATEASAQHSTVVLETRADTSMWHAVATFTAAPDALEDASLPHLLEMFARRQACEPRESGRIAWVLALCKRVAEAHEGAFEQGELVDGQPVKLSLRIPLNAG
ncbi:sensor histidine kinase [Paraburkholderia solisilvae]|nr:HAMP domain-containing sensor histidine kinase [Paraburkholderia solisilvae]